MQVPINAEARLVIATCAPRPDSRNDCTVYRASGIAEQLTDRPVMADDGYQGVSEVAMPYQKPRDSSDLLDWKEDLNTTHRKVRARVEHVLARMRCRKYSATTVVPRAPSPT